MAQSAFRQGISPRTLSFKGTVQILNAFQAKIAFVNNDKLSAFFEALLDAVAGHRVGNRPGRHEPRAVKRRPKPYPRLTVPRAQAANLLF